MEEKDYLPLEDLLDAVDGSVYRLTILAAKRALQLADGAKPLVDSSGEKLLDTALKEIAEKKVRATKKEKEKE